MRSISHWVNTKDNKNLLVTLLQKRKFFFSKSSNDFEKLKSFLQSNLETYEFQQRKFWEKIFLIPVHKESHEVV